MQERGEKMGLWKKFIETYTEPVKKEKQPKSNFWNRLIETYTEPVEQTHHELEFADSGSVEELSESLSGKIQAKNQELKMLRMSLESIDLERFPQSQKVVETYNQLCDDLAQLLHEEQNLNEDDTLAVINLETRYQNFEREYEEKSSIIKSMYWLNELKKQNNNMNLDFNKTPINKITDKKLESYKLYIQKISSQRTDFSFQFGDELIDELIIAEYRLRMLMLMKAVSKGMEIKENPFSSEKASKKARYEALLLADIEKASQQYERIDYDREKYTKLKLYDESDFQKLDKQAQDILEGLNNAMIDDLSISELFADGEVKTLKKLVKLKAKMNEIASKSDQIISYEKKKIKKGNVDYDDDDDIDYMKW